MIKNVRFLKRCNLKNKIQPPSTDEGFLEETKLAVNTCLVTIFGISEFCCILRLFL